ncbi:MAG: hypothetical protein RI922_1606 [Bacteroidota bacterium]|jgi:hypothetical protein
MRIALFIIFLGFFSSRTAYGQKVTHPQECEEMDASFKSSLKKNDFKQSAILFNSLASNCPEKEVLVLPEYLAFLKRQISNQKNLSIKEQIIDSTEQIYVRMETNHLYSTSEDIIRATYLMNSPNSNSTKLDELLNRIIHTHPEGCSESLIMMYYVNLNVLYSSRQGDVKHEYWKRLVNDYYYLSTSFSLPKISPDTQKTLDLYYASLTKKCSSLTESIPYCISTLSSEEKQRSTELNNYLSIFEHASCINSTHYNQLLDSLNALDFSNSIFLKKATYYRLNKDFSKEFSALYFAKNASSDVRFIDSLHLLEATCQLNMGNYSEAFRLAMQSSSNFKSELRETAIQSVLLENGSCANTEKQKTLNSIYAHVLLTDAKRSKLVISASLEDTVISNQPKEDQRKRLGIIAGQRAYLDCWQITLNIP